MSPATCTTATLAIPHVPQPEKTGKRTEQKAFKNQPGRFRTRYQVDSSPKVYTLLNTLRGCFIT